MDELKDGDVVQTQDMDYAVIVQDAAKSREYLQKSKKLVPQVTGFIRLKDFSGFTHYQHESLNIRSIVGNIHTESTCTRAAEFTCDHNFIPRSLVKSGEWCTKCGEIKP